MITSTFCILTENHAFKNRIASRPEPGHPRPQPNQCLKFQKYRCMQFSANAGRKISRLSEEIQQGLPRWGTTLIMSRRAFKLIGEGTIHVCFISFYLLDKTIFIHVKNTPPPGPNILEKIASSWYSLHTMKDNECLLTQTYFNWYFN